MIIERKNQEEVNFKDLEVGEVFCYRGAYYMKVEENYSEGISAIELEDGEISDFYSDEKVIKVNAKLIIE